MTVNRPAFYAAVRASLFGGRLSDPQVQGMGAMLDAAPPDMPLDHLAYCLATAFHETGQKMQPVVENLNYTSAARIRQVWPSRFPSEAAAKPFAGNPQALANKVYGGRMGNVGVDDGWTYRGRGFVQITGRDNYARAGRKLLADLVRRPELATNCGTAAAIMFAGMTDGWFTGAKLSDYFGPGKNDPVNARRIINGLDEAQKVAGYYAKFLVALDVTEAAPPPIPVLPIPSPTPQPASSGFFAAFISWLKGLRA